MTMRELSLTIALDAIEDRAKMDGHINYDAEVDEEGYVLSLLIALRHWCGEYGFDWTAHLEQAEDHFEEDLSEEALVKV